MSSFVKNVCNIIFRTNMMYLNIPAFDKFTKKMMPNVNMLTPTIVSSRTVSWGLKLLCYPHCLWRSNTEEKGVLVKCN